MAETENGWVKIDRSILNHWIWQKADYAHAWIDLILLANHKDNVQLYNGKLTTFKRGTVCRSMKSLADRWKWDRKKVRKFLAALESDNMVTIITTTHGTTISLVNYDKFQCLGTTKGATDTTTEGQPLPQPLPTNKNDKNDKNDKNNIYISESGKPKTEKAEKIKHKYGQYSNVLLTDQELEKLKSEFPADYQERIENLSAYMASTGKSYKNHLATIRNWARRNDTRTGSQNTQTATNKSTWNNAPGQFARRKSLFDD